MPYFRTKNIATCKPYFRMEKILSIPHACTCSVVVALDRKVLDAASFVKAKFENGEQSSYVSL